MTVLTSMTQPIWLENLPRRPLCDVPWMGTSVVLSDGNVDFCCFSSAVVGNVNEEPFEQIWNGTLMQGIRQALREQHLPSECQSTSCPIYRGDVLHYIFDRMDGTNRFSLNETHHSHAQVRSGLRGSELRVNRNTRANEDRLKVDLRLTYEGSPLEADLFVGIRHPDGVIRFLPNLEEYPVPFATVQLTEGSGPLEIVFLDEQPDSLQTIADREICTALFEPDSNPNLHTNCYWSISKLIKM